jgi:sortase A
MIGPQKTILAGTALICFGLWQLVEGSWIHAKAALAKILVSAAWTETLAYGKPARPWPWADTWPVARLRFPTLDRELPVLSGASGATLAFGPGHLDGTAAPGTIGHSVIAGHRDTSFSELGDLRRGDPVSVQVRDGSWRLYRVTGTAIADARLPWTLSQPTDKGSATLTLVTCWPLNSVIPGSPMRYLVLATEETERNAIQYD